MTSDENVTCMKIVETQYFSGTCDAKYFSGMINIKIFIKKD